MRISDWSSDVCSSDLLYDAFSGNAALRPERSKSYDVGIDQSLADGRALISLTAFLRNTTDQINYDNSAFTYGNIDRTRAKGIEATLALRPVDALNVTASYSYHHARARSEIGSAPGRHRGCT